MGNFTTSITCHSSKNLLFLQNFQQQLSKCMQLQPKQCEIYGQTYFFEHASTHKFMIQEVIPSNSLQNNSSKVVPSNHCLHYFMESNNMLILPTYTLLENYHIEMYHQQDKIMQLILSISEICLMTDVGLGKKRLAISDYSIRNLLENTNSQQNHKQNGKQWKIFGIDYTNPYWNYQAIVQNSQRSQDVYLSPQLMSAYSKDKIYPKINIKKSDVFILAIMVLQIIFEENLLQKVYNYNEFEIKLKPLLIKLSMIEQKFSEPIYRLFVKMLEFDPKIRISFEEIIIEIQKLRQNKNKTYSPSFVDKTEENGYKTVTPINCKPKTGSPFLKQCEQRDREARNKGRSPGAIRKNIPDTDRSLSISNCNSRRRISIPCAKISSGNFGYQQDNENYLPQIEPFGLLQRNSNRISNKNVQNNTQKTKFQNIRY